MTELDMEAAFNEWMHRYSEHPDSFEREWVCVQKFLAERAGAGIPRYGQLMNSKSCVAYLKKLAVSKPELSPAPPNRKTTDGCLP